MDLTRKLVAVTFLAGVAVAIASAPAMAKPQKHRVARALAAESAGAASYVDPATQPSSRMPTLGMNEAAAPAAVAAPTRRRSRVAKIPAANNNAAPASASAFASGDLVSEARRYMGGNPTGRGSLWCGAFVDLVLKRTGRKGGGNLASAYARYGTRVSSPQVGAIAVITRKGGGHVGVVSGVDSAGNPIVISGNHNNKVGESVYPRGRIIAYVVP